MSASPSTKSWGALLAAGLVCLGQPPSGAESAAVSSGMPTASFDELIFQMQRYGNTATKRAQKASARAELVKRGPASLRALMERVQIDNVMIRAYAQEIVELLKADEAAPVLLTFLDAPAPATRKLAVYFLGSHDTPQYAARVLPLLDDEEAAGAALRTLGKWKVASAVPRIVPFLQHEKEMRRVAAANALRDIGAASAVPPLLAALDDPMFTVRETAARALEACGPVAVQAMLQALPAAPPQQKRCLIRALEDMKARKAIRSLRRLLTDPNADVQADAREALERIAP